MAKLTIVYSCRTGEHRELKKEVLDASGRIHNCRCGAAKSLRAAALVRNVPGPVLTQMHRADPLRWFSLSPRRHQNSIG
jgi:hypothetical protein